MTFNIKIVKYDRDKELKQTGELLFYLLMDYDVFNSKYHYCKFREVELTILRPDDEGNVYCGHCNKKIPLKICSSI